MKRFTRVYPLSKTLRFELKPIGKTLEFIQSNGLLKQDQHRAESYVKVKKIIDDYHKTFISSVLVDFKLNYTDEGKKNSLEEFYLYYMIRTKEEVQQKAFDDIKDKLRKQIADAFSKSDVFKRIDKKELIKEDLLTFVQTSEERALVEEFKDFTTYFTGFHENRKNMYSAEAQSTAIAYRLIHENLPRFIDNMGIFDKVKVSSLSDVFAQIYTDYESYLNVTDIREMFVLSYFNVVLTQVQIDVYNSIVGELNKHINLFNQQQKDKSKKLPKLKLLYKQILSDRNAIHWLPEEFESDEDVLMAIERAYAELNEWVLCNERSLKELLCHLSDYDLNGIYVCNDLQLTDISQKMFGSWEMIQKAMIEELKRTVPRKSKSEKNEAYEERIQKMYKSFKSISIAQINHSLASCKENDVKTIEGYFSNLGTIHTDTIKRENLFVRIENAYTDVKELLNTPYPKEKSLAQDKYNVEKIKKLLDAFKDLQHFVKPLLGMGDEAEKDEKFYGEFVALWEELDKITSLYNMVRNYMTKKPYSIKKIKLNFENSTLMNGWDVNKERDNTTVILRKDGLYYLAIMNKKYNRVFDVDVMENHGDCYEKMEYKLLPGANKMLPKVFFSKSRIDEFRPSEAILENYKKETHKKGENFKLEDCHALIDFFKSSIEKHEDWNKFGFKFSDTCTYQDLSGFYREVEQQGYKISFRAVSKILCK